MCERAKGNAKGFEIRYSRPILVLKSGMESVARPPESGQKIIGVRSSQNRFFLFLTKNRGIRPHENDNLPHKAGGCIREGEPGGTPVGGAMWGGAAEGGARGGGHRRVGRGGEGHWGVGWGRG